MADRDVVITVDMGGTNLRVALVENDTILDRVMLPTPRGADAIADLIGEQAVKLSKNLASAIAIAAPGSVSQKLGGLTKAPNLPELNGYSLVNEVTKRTNIPCIVDNDANAYAMGEATFGAARGMESVVVYTLGTGVGGGVVFNGKIWRGADGVAGEMGHVCIEEHGRLCSCGAHGCVEAYSSASSMLRLAKEYGSNANTAKEAFEQANEGDEGAKKAFQRAGTALGIAIAGIVNTLNPNAVVIGGGGSAAFPLLEHYVREQLAARAFPAAYENLKLLKGSLGNDAAILGGAALIYSLR